MKTVEFGKENHQVIMLLHGGGCPGGIIVKRQNY